MGNTDQPREKKRINRLALLLALIPVAYISFWAIASALPLILPNAQITIQNTSAETLTNVRIALRSEPVWTGDLRPGETQKWNGHFGGEASAHVTFNAGERLVTHECCYVDHVTGWPLHFVISPTLEVREIAQ